MGMKRGFFAIAVAVAAAAVFVGVAAAATGGLTGGTVTPGGTITIGGTIGSLCIPDVGCESGYAQLYIGLNCNEGGVPSGDPIEFTVPHTGDYSVDITLPNTPAPSGYSVEVSGPTEDSVCVNLPLNTAVAAGVTPPPGIFLCYSVDQTQPGVWPKDVAEVLLTQGYWLPYAVSGNQSGGTNLGSYNLVCNIAATQSVSDSYVGGDGTVLGPDYAGATVALYPKVGG